MRDVLLRMNLWTAHTNLLKETSHGKGSEMRDVTWTPHASKRDEHHMMSVVRKIPNGFRWAGVVLIVACGLIHLISAPDHLQEATYVGVLFLASFAGALVAALGIYRDRLWGVGY